MNTKTFSITPDQMASFRTLAAANGITLPAGDTGEATDPAYDLVMDFSYDGKSTLTLTLVADAWWLPDSEVWSNLEKYLTPATS